MINIKIQHQIWLNLERYIIWVFSGSAQLEIYNEPRDGVQAYLYALWVDKTKRQKGLASQLLKKAEEVAASRGVKEIYLYWHPAEAPLWTRKWYERNGYTAERLYNDGKILLRKLLI